MTELLYYDDQYQKKFEATITDVDGNWVALDKTIFYPTGGGQPSDTGILTTDDDRDFIVVEAVKKDGVIWHRLVEPEGLEKGMNVSGQIDWTRRHWFMRLHTASHVLSRLLIKEAGVSVSGNNLSSEKARIDFTLEDFDKDYMQTFEEKTNEVLAKNLPVTTVFLSREEASQEEEIFTLLKELPETIKQIRVVQVGDDPVIDRSACGGTHLKSTGEAGKVKFLKLENKGKQRRRISFTLE
ncbi:MAG: alanyl-tRNA editing protein [Nanobdellota archaeon]